MIVIARLSFAAESPPSRGAWIEIMNFSNLSLTASSPPSRGAWIEIQLFPEDNGGV